MFSAYDSQGVKIHGEIEASDVELARRKLLGQHLMLVSLQEAEYQNKGLSFLARKHISSKELEFFTSELSLLLNSGVTIDRGLGVIRRNSSSIPQSRLIANLHDAVRSGVSLSEAMTSEDSVFNPLYINLVKLGESTGTLPMIFQRLSLDIKFQSELKSKIVQAVTYPAIVFLVCILCIVFIFNYIVPQMSGLFDGLPEIPAHTAFLLGLSDWMIPYQWFLLIGILGAILVIYTIAKTPAGMRELDELLLRIPGASGLLIMVERIRFNTAIAMMLESGVLIDRCLEMAIGNVRNQTIRQGLVVAKDGVKKGNPLSGSLASSPLYPDFAISLIEVGEETGNMGPVFVELSQRSRREFEAWVIRFTALLEPILILVMGGIVGGVVVTMLLSIVSVNDIGI